MLTWRRGQRAFTVRVAGVAIMDDHVLLQTTDHDPFWVLPGGRVELGESSAVALARELREEVGAEPRVGRLLWVVENFFDYRAVAHQEVGFYYKVALASPTTPTDRPTFVGQEPGFTLDFRWTPLDELDRLALYPDFLTHALRHLPNATEHVVHVDTPAPPTSP